VLDLGAKNGGRDRDRTCDPYHVKVRHLKRALAESDEDSRAAANEAIREIVEKVVISSTRTVQARGDRDLRPTRRPAQDF
jgi:hypothetical protein